jgi:transaldolase
MTTNERLAGPLEALRGAGVSIWLDSLSRELLETGRFERLVRDLSVTGATSNPTIFAAAMTGSDRYDAQIRSAVANGVTEPQEIFFRLALEDVQRAADVLRSVHDESGGADGFVSLECTPDLADDTEGTIAQALELWARLNRENVMIKVPATAAAVPAVEALTSRGVNVNVTLLFSLERYDQIIEAYLRGLEARVARGEPVSHISSVASFFVSRVDAKAEPQLPPDSPLRGRLAIANAAAAYDLWQERFADQRWQRLHDLGARSQRPLWASTGTKDPAYSDVLYVEALVASGVVNTMPMRTLRAFADHGVADASLPDSGARAVLDAAAEAGVDLEAITAQLERDGVEAFCTSYAKLLDCIAAKLLNTVGR